MFLFNWNDIINLITEIIILTISIQYLIIYIGRKSKKEETYNLYFSIFSFCLLFLILVNSRLLSLLTHLTGEEPVIYFLFTNTGNIMLYSSIKLFNAFLKYPVQKQKLFRFPYVFIVIVFFLSIMNFFAFEIYKRYFGFVIIYCFVIIIIYSASIHLVFVIRNKVYKQRSVFLVFIGFLILTVNIIVNITLHAITQNPSSNNFLAIGISIFVFVYFMASKANSDHNDLIQLNKDLEQKVLERTKEIGQKTEALIKSERFAAIGRLIAGIAHQIMNPLQNILGPLLFIKLRLSKKNQLDSKIEKYINDIEASSEKINKTISALRNLNYVGVKDNEKINIYNCIDNILTIIQPEYKDRIQFIVKVEKDLIIESNETGINNILINVINNAIDAIIMHQDSGIIEICANGNDNCFEITITDNGIGIKPENVNLIFLPDYSTKPSGRNSGTGMGLYIVKEFADRLNIKIEVMSKFQKGTTIRLLGKGKR